MGHCYLVTGATGHLGNTILRLLSKRGERTRALVLPGDRLEALAGLDCAVYYGDVREVESMAEFLTLPQGETGTVLHCAGVVSTTAREDPRLADVNVTGAQNVARECLRRGLPLVYVSSVHAIAEETPGIPIRETRTFDPALVSGAYAKTKAEATAAVLELVREGLDARVVHPSGIIGPYDFGKGHLTQMVLAYLNGSLSACVPGGYDFVDVRDVAAGVVAAAQRGRAGECYILSGHFVDIREALDLVSRSSGRRPIRTVLPMWFAKATAPLAELYYRVLGQPPLYSDYSLEVLGSNGLFDCAKAVRELGYTTRPFEKTVADTVRWLDSRGKVKRGLSPFRLG